MAVGLLAGAYVIGWGLHVFAHAGPRLMVPAEGSKTEELRFSEHWPLDGWAVPRMQAPGEMEVETPAEGEYVIGYECRTVFRGVEYVSPERWPDFDLQVISVETGEDIGVQKAAGTTYQIEDHKGEIVGKVQIPSAGRYLVRARRTGEEGGPRVVLSFSRDPFMQLVVPGFTVVAGLVVGLAAAVLAALLAAITFLRRMLSLSAPPPEEADLRKAVAEESQDAHIRTWALLCHLSGLLIFGGLPFGNIIGPLAVWLLGREESALVDDQGREALNFQLSMMVYGLVASALVLVLIGLPLLFLLVALDVVLVTMAAVRAGNGELYRYPITIRFV